MKNCLYIIGIVIFIISIINCNERKPQKELNKKNSNVKEQSENAEEPQSNKKNTKEKEQIESTEKPEKELKKKNNKEKEKKQIKGKDENFRKGEEIKLIAFEMAKTYSKNFTELKNSTLTLVSHEIPSKNNKYISKYIFGEQGKGNSKINKIKIGNVNKNKKNEKSFLYFRICVPKEKSKQAYLDLFCPFVPCLDYDEFLRSNLSCLKDLSTKIINKISDINKLA